MTGKKRYYKLDDLGPIGTQKEKSAAERKRIYEKTAEIIKAEKSERSGKAKRA